MNTAIAPGDDFYRYVNGNWLEDTAIPADRSNYGAFTVLADEAETDLRSIIEEAAAEDAAIGSDAQKVGDFYTSFMNQDVIERLGINPLQETLAQLDAVSNRQDMLEVMTALNYIGVQMPFSFYINVDERQTDQYIAYVFQSGLGLPDRDWYLQDDETYLEARPGLFGLY